MGPFLGCSSSPCPLPKGIGTLASPLCITRMLWSKAPSGTKGSTLACAALGGVFFTHFDVFAALKGFFSLTLVVLLPWEGFFQSLWCFWHHFHMCQEPCPLILPEHPQSFSSLARGHPRAGCSFLPSLHLTAGNPQIWGPTSSCCPHIYPKPMRPAAKSPPSATFDG